MNKLILIGNLGKDPEMSYTPNGKAVTKFSLAVSRRYHKEDGPDTDWFTITAWNQLAETCNNLLKKGQKVYVEGRLEPREYQDRNGNNRVSLDVVISEMEKVTPKERQEQDDLPTDEDMDNFYNNPF